MVKNKHYLVYDENIKNPKKIALFADIHYSNTFKEKKFKLIKDNLLCNKPDYICVPGDIIDSTNVLDCYDNQEKFLNFFEEVGKIAPTFISLGSHDFSRLDSNGWTCNYNKKWFHELNNLDNVHLLHNSKFDCGDITFTGYTANYEYYYNDTKEESSKLLIDSLNNNTINQDDDKCNILLFHSPIRIMDKSILKLEALKNIRLILAGHMHNGMIPPIIDELIDNDKGLIAPNKSLFPDNSRGKVTKFVDDKIIDMVISSGITKLAECSPSVLHPFNEVYPMGIEYIKIKK